MVRCLGLATQLRKRWTSSGLRTMSSFCGFLGVGMMSSTLPILVQRDFVEETQSGHGDEDGSGSQLPFVGQIHLVGTNLFRTQLVGWLAEISSKQRDRRT